MAGPGYKAVNLPEELVAHIDKFLDENSVGFRSRAELAATAIREFLDRQTDGAFSRGFDKEELRRLIQEELAKPDA